MNHYPKTAGWKESAVSRKNAQANQPRFSRMKQVVLNLYKAGFVGTADQAADFLDISPFSTRPRCTELVKDGLLTRVRVDRSRPGRHKWVLRLNTDSADDRPEGYYHTALEPPEEPPFDDGQPDERQEWHDYDPDC